MQSQIGKDEVQKHIKHRTLGSYQLYIYKSGIYYVLQMEYRSKDNPDYHWGKNVSYDTKLPVVDLVYKHCIEDYKLRMGE